VLLNVQLIFNLAKLNEAGTVFRLLEIIDFYFILNLHAREVQIHEPVRTITNASNGTNVQRLDTFEVCFMFTSNNCRLLHWTRRSGVYSFNFYILMSWLYRFGIPILFILMRFVFTG
jgi:hypothetical protein